MNITVDDIRKIPAGTKKTFRCESGEKLYSAKSLVYYCNRVNKPKDVWKYILKSEYEELTITITAVSIDGIKQTNSQEEHEAD